MSWEFVIRWTVPNPSYPTEAGNERACKKWEYSVRIGLPGVKMYCYNIPRMSNLFTWADFRSCKRPCPRGASWWRQSGWRRYRSEKRRRSPTCPFPRRVGRASPVLTTWKKKRGGQIILICSSYAYLQNMWHIYIRIDALRARTTPRGRDRGLSLQSFGSERGIFPRQMPR